MRTEIIQNCAITFRFESQGELPSPYLESVLLAMPTASIAIAGWQEPGYKPCRLEIPAWTLADHSPTRFALTWQGAYAARSWQVLFL